MALPLKDNIIQGIKVVLERAEAGHTTADRRFACRLLCFLHRGTTHAAHEGGNVSKMAEQGRRGGASECAWVMLAVFVLCVGDQPRPGSPMGR